MAQRFQAAAQQVINKQSPQLATIVDEVTILQNYFSQKKDNKPIVKFRDSDTAILKIIYQSSFLDSEDISSSISTYSEVRNMTICKGIQYMVKPSINGGTDPCCASNSCKKQENIRQEWLTCDNTCYKQLTTLVEQEIKSTAYYIRLLVNSIIYIPRKGESELLELQFNANLDSSKITGKWENDKNLITINGFNNDKNNRLIMGFGPSASGKTFMTQEVIKLFMKNDDIFPNIFVTIDGGLTREMSESYTEIVKKVSKYALGIENLMTPGGIKKLYTDDLFEAGKIKKKLTEYLKKEYYINHISIYVPETLGSCNITGVVTRDLTIGSCEKKIEEFLELTGNPDKWIGLLIYQHVTHKDCDYIHEFKCAGTTESGKSREAVEGKKYSAAGWNASMRNGRYMLEKTPGYRLEIHNSGVPFRRAVILDRTPGASTSQPKPLKDYVNTELFHYCFANNCPEVTNKTKFEPSNINYEMIDKILNHLYVLENFIRNPNFISQNKENVEKSFESLKKYMSEQMNKQLSYKDGKYPQDIEPLEKIPSDNLSAIQYILARFIVIISTLQQFKEAEGIIKDLIIKEKKYIMKFIPKTNLIPIEKLDRNKQTLIKNIKYIQNILLKYKGLKIEGGGTNIQYYRFNNSDDLNL